MAIFPVSIIMPALNEANNIEAAIADVETAFKKVGIQGEIVVINDGSTDATRAKVEALQTGRPHLKLINHAAPQGIGSSFWDGVQQASGDVVTLIPGDGENETYEILRYLPLMEHVDIVVPFVVNREARGFRRRLLSKTYKAIINLSFGLLLNYMNGTVMYRRHVLKSLSLRSKGFFYQTELLIKAIKRGFMYAEVPYLLAQRGTGKSKAVTFKSFLKVSRDYLSTIKAVYVTGNAVALESLPEGSVTTERRKEQTWSHHVAGRA